MDKISKIFNGEKYLPKKCTCSCRCKSKMTPEYEAYFEELKQVVMDCAKSFTGSCLDNYEDAYKDINANFWDLIKATIVLAEACGQLMIRKEFLAEVAAQIKKEFEEAETGDK